MSSEKPPTELARPPGDALGDFDEPSNDIVENEGQAVSGPWDRPGHAPGGVCFVDEGVDAGPLVGQPLLYTPNHPARHRVKPCKPGVQKQVVPFIVFKYGAYAIGVLG